MGAVLIKLGIFPLVVPFEDTPLPTIPILRLLMRIIFYELFMAASLIPLELTK